MALSVTERNKIMDEAARMIDAALHRFEYENDRTKKKFVAAITDLVPGTHRVTKQLVAEIKQLVGIRGISASQQKDQMVFETCSESAFLDSKQCEVYIRANRKHNPVFAMLMDRI